MEWPPVFQKINLIVQQLVFSFNFFAPECSVQAPYHQRWFFTTFAPYVLLIPLFISYAMLRGFL